MALTTGPHQPEYINYSEPGSSDMVNLLTGDFSFDLPVFEVPGPEGGFSVPLSYNGGVSLDQESSWVGLGWTLNSGAIIRSINEFPDDASGESHTITVKDLTGMRGWNSNILGIGRMGWSNLGGHYGNLSLLSIVNAEWSEDHSSVGIAGINVTDNGPKFNPMQFGMAVITVATWGAGAAASAGGVTAGQIAKQVAISSASSIAMSGISSLAQGSNSPSAPTSGYWPYSKTEKKNWLLKAATGFVVNVNEYKIWLDKTRNEQMYGTLYLGNTPFTSVNPDPNHVSLSVKNGGVSETLYAFSNSSNEGSASDINYQSHPNDDLKEFYEINNPVALAPDNFSVKAAGISGSISPYRLDIGSVSMPRAMASGHQRLAPLPYLTNSTNNKVPFIYNGQISNAYYHHVGSSTSVTRPVFYSGLNAVAGNSDPAVNDALTYDLDDVIFKEQRIRPDLNTYKKIPQSNFIEWLSNYEIRSDMTYASKFMDYFSGGTGETVSPTSERYLQRTNLPFGSLTSYTYTQNLSGTIPISASDIGKFNVDDVIDLNISLYNDAQGSSEGTTTDYQPLTGFIVTGVNSSTSPYSITVNDSRLFPYYGKYANIEIAIHKSPQSLSSIGGFCITAQDGTTYHFALPIYDYEQYTEVRDASDPLNKRSIIKRTAPFANTWLLTGITGSDFIDRNQNGIIDESDWGHWVKLNYGTHLNDYKWRLPFSEHRKLPDGAHESFTEGKKQLLYLNSIETRSHVGLFIKGDRSDSKSTTSQYPLKLDEVLLISREHYKKITTPVNEGGLGLTNFSNKTNFLLKSTGLSTDMRNFLNQNCMKRVIFSYTYDLAPNTLNSTASGGGKLTLAKVSILGRNSLKIVPDYLFEYGNNPAYNKDHWDAWGMYNPAATSMGGTHGVSQTDAHGSAWSLTKITTPLGGEININYERDTYSSISGMTFSNQGPSFENLNFDVYYPTGLPITKLTLNNPSSYFEVGDSVNVFGYADYSCSNNPGSLLNKAYSTHARIVAIGSNYIDLGVDYMGIDCNLTNSGEYIHFQAQVGQVAQPLKNRKGGEIRVSSISIKDEFQKENKNRYLYQNPDGTSSGVIAQEPDYVYGPYHLFTDYLGYPQTPVLYQRVTVLGGKLTTDSDFVSRHVYEFETPHHSQLTLTQSVIKDTQLIRNTVSHDDFVSVFWNKYEDRTSAIGRLKSVNIYDKNGAVHSSSTMIYTDQLLNDGVNNYQGYYTKGALMFDKINSGSNQYHKLNRTTVIQYPSVLKKIINSRDGFTSQSENKSWDFYTGRVLEKINKSPLGLYVKSVVKPAYAFYPELGSKGFDPANKNMLSQVAATYVYRSDAMGNSLGLISAEAQTWQKDWDNYRHLNGTAYEEEGTQSNPVWRKNASYVWKGNMTRLQTDYGTQSFSQTDEFNFAGTNTLWQYLGESKLFDHYGMPLEGVDKNNIYSAVKMGSDNRTILASASNAKYNEIAFSSAEDKIPEQPYFGGEVGLGSGTLVNTPVHTGNTALSVSSGYGFIFKSNELSTTKTYRASVWANSTNGRIYYKLNNGSEVVSASQTVSQAVAIPGMGNWYRIDLTITNPSSAIIEIGAMSNSGTVVFDDFRFQPADAAMTCYVHTPLEYEFSIAPPEYSPSYSYTLDNDNLFTKVESNEKGEVVKVYAETVKYGVKLVSESKRNYRRNTVNP